MGIAPGQPRRPWHPGDTLPQPDKETVSRYWTNFAKHGDPNGPGVPAWPEFTESNRQVMVFHDEAHPGVVPSPEGLEVLDRYFAWRRTPEGEVWAE